MHALPGQRQDEKLWTTLLLLLIGQIHIYPTHLTLDLLHPFRRLRTELKAQKFPRRLHK